MKNKKRINLYARYSELDKQSKSVNTSTVIITFLVFFLVVGSALGTFILYDQNESLKRDIASLTDYLNSPSNIEKRDLVLAQEAELANLISVASQIDALNLIEYSLPKFDSKFINLLMANKKVDVKSLNYFTTGINISAVGSDISQPNIYVDYLRNLGYFDKVEYSGFSANAEANDYSFNVTCYFDRDYDYQIEDIVILEKEPTDFSNGNTASNVDIDDVNSINYVVTKNRSIDKDYVPSLTNPQVNMLKSDISLNSTIVDSLQQMFTDAQNDGVNLVLGSGYRSYNEQASIYDGFVAEKGDKAQYVSAKPGYSEHQLGLAIDLTDNKNACWLSTCFKDTNAYSWLTDNAYKYGFIERYPDGKTDITGYIYMPWHYRYIGVDEASKVNDSGLTLEEYYGLVE